MRFVLPAIALLLVAGQANAAHCRKEEEESRGFCCPNGSEFSGVDCVPKGTKPATQDAEKKITHISVLPVLKGGRGRITMSVDGGQTQAVSDKPLAFDVDATKAWARVDIQGDEIYDAHTYVPVGVDRALTVERTLTQFPNLIVAIHGAIPDGFINAKVIATCVKNDKGVEVHGEDQTCSLDGYYERTCGFNLSKCQAASVRVAGNVETQTDKPVSIPAEGTRHLDLDFVPHKTSGFWLALPIGLTLGSIGMLVASAAVSGSVRTMTSSTGVMTTDVDQTASNAFLGIGMGLLAIDLVAGPWVVADIIAPRTKATRHTDENDVKDCDLPATIARRSTPVRVGIGIGGFVARW